MRSLGLPDARDQAEANPSRVVGVAGELLPERAVFEGSAKTLERRVLGAVGRSDQVEVRRSGSEKMNADNPT